MLSDLAQTTMSLPAGDVGLAAGVLGVLMLIFKIIGRLVDRVLDKRSAPPIKYDGFNSRDREALNAIARQQLEHNQQQARTNEMMEKAAQTMSRVADAQERDLELAKLRHQMIISSIRHKSEE